MARTKERIVPSLADDDNGLVETSAVAIAGFDVDAIAASQAIDVAADTNDLATGQNPHNAADNNDLAALQASAAGVPLSLEAAAATISPSRRITFTSASNLSGINYTIVGVGVSPAGAPITGEVRVGPNNTTVASVNAYSSITSITPDGSSANTVSVGWPTYLNAGLTLESVASALIPPRQISLTSGASANFSNVSITVTGLGNAGQALSETIAGPNNTTVNTTAFFSSVSAITFQRTAASVDANISAGWLANSVPQPLTPNGVLGNGIGQYSDLFGPSKVQLFSSDDLSSLTFRIIGLGTGGQPQDETIQGPGAGATVSTVDLYTSVLSITPSDDAAGAVTAGVVGMGGSPLPLETTVLDPPRRLMIDGSGDLATVVFTITGRDRNGRAITEQVTGVTTDPVTTRYIYAEVDSIVPDRASSETVVVGWGTEVISAPVMLDHFTNPFNVGIGVVASGSINYTIQHTFDDLQVVGTADGDGEWFDHEDLDGATDSADGNYAFPVEAVRLVLNSGTGSARMRVIQSGPN